ncbi:hypothetical protein [Actinomyces gerencseriae]|uniref:hypothetical protein n=1 Tax=Actinomyces gerencseriae TaxID=52769 RepID=UPI0023F4E920|nr:hypothetical protein [Actinomyces gerencseriae]
MATLSPTAARAEHTARLVGSVCVPAGAGDYRALLATHHKIANPASRGTAYLSDPSQYVNMDRQAAEAADLGLRFVIDLSYIRDLVVSDGGRWHLMSADEWQELFSTLLLRTGPYGRPWALERTLDGIVLARDPDILAGARPAGSVDAYMQSMLAQATAVRRLGFDGAIVSGGLRWLTDSGGTAAYGDALDQLASAEWIDMVALSYQEQLSQTVVAACADIVQSHGGVPVCDGVASGRLGDAAGALRASGVVAVGALPGASLNVSQWAAVVQSVTGKAAGGGGGAPAPAPSVPDTGWQDAGGGFQYRKYGPFLSVRRQEEWSVWNVTKPGEVRVFDFPAAIKGQGRVNMAHAPLVTASYVDDGSTVSLWPNGTLTAHVKATGNYIFPTITTVQG